MALKIRKVATTETRFIDSRNLTDEQLNERIAKFERDGFEVVEYVYMPEVPRLDLNAPVICAVELERRATGGGE